MNLREKKKALVVGLTEAGVKRLDTVTEQYGLHTRTEAVKHVAKNVVRVLGEMKMSLRRCTGCRPITADERDGSVVLMLTTRECAQLRSAVAAVGVSGLSEFLEGALMLFFPECG